MKEKMRYLDYLIIAFKMRNVMAKVRVYIQSNMALKSEIEAKVATTQLVNINAQIEALSNFILKVSNCIDLNIDYENNIEADLRIIASQCRDIIVSATHNLDAEMVALATPNQLLYVGLCEALESDTNMISIGGDKLYVNNNSPGIDSLIIIHSSIERFITIQLVNGYITNLLFNTITSNNFYLRNDYYLLSNVLIEEALTSVSKINEEIYPLINVSALTADNKLICIDLLEKILIDVSSWLRTSTKIIKVDSLIINEFNLLIKNIISQAFNINEISKIDTNVTFVSLIINYIYYAFVSSVYSDIQMESSDSFLFYLSQNINDLNSNMLLDPSTSISGYVDTLVNLTSEYILKNITSRTLKINSVTSDTFVSTISIGIEGLRRIGQAAVLYYRDIADMTLDELFVYYSN